MRNARVLSAARRASAPGPPGRRIPRRRDRGPPFALETVPAQDRGLVGHDNDHVVHVGVANRHDRIRDVAPAGGHRLERPGRSRFPYLQSQECHRPGDRAAASESTGRQSEVLQWARCSGGKAAVLDSPLIGTSCLRRARGRALARAAELHSSRDVHPRAQRQQRRCRRSRRRPPAAAWPTRQALRTPSAAPPGVTIRHQTPGPSVVRRSV